MKRKQSAERKLKEFLIKQTRKTCSNCSYYRDGYCNDLDERKSPDDYCSDENYYS